MRLEHSGEFEDIKFTVACLDGRAEFVKIDAGVRLADEDGVHSGLDGVLTALLRKYSPGETEKKLKRAKRMRERPEAMKAETGIPGTLAFHALYRQMVATGTLKHKAFIDDMAQLIRAKLEIDTDIQLLDVQAGLIKRIEDAPNLDRLYVEDVIARREMTVLSGLREHVPREDLLGKSFLFVTNMKPANFRGLESEGMILCTRTPEGKAEPIQSQPCQDRGSKWRATMAYWTSMRRPRLI
jgi:aminoacyl tRNA synthase complex-interacting multifunctional protein 1